MSVFVCTPGFEEALAQELGLARGGVDVLDAGLVAVPALPESSATSPIDPVFSRQVLPGPRELDASSIAKLAAAAFDAMADALDAAPSFVVHAFAPFGAEPSLFSRARLVREGTLALMKERRRRTHRRLREEVDPATPWWAAQILLLGPSRALVSAAEARPLPRGGWQLAPWPAGAAPVARDRVPPSRAYQKAEEAYQWMGACPLAGETVVDLGGSPGGWSYTALRRGAKVTAVDRAPLEPPVAGHPALTEVRADAFRYVPDAPVDWLLCDVIAEPTRSLGLVQSWVEGRWARNLVVTIKFKGSDGYGLLSALPALFAEHRPAFARVKHLSHNKNEVTVMLRF